MTRSAIWSPTRPPSAACACPAARSITHRFAPAPDPRAPPAAPQPWAGPAALAAGGRRRTLPWAMNAPRKALRAAGRVGCRITLGRRRLRRPRRRA
ncbi:hypothetical protein EYE35_00130 [Cereibacter sphaeroides]|nr:hypothetical protein EYE35_00130 [Cereibacter sphaeroides]